MADPSESPTSIPTVSAGRRTSLVRGLACAVLFGVCGFCIPFAVLSVAPLLEIAFTHMEAIDRAEAFEQVIAKDASFAPAYAGLAEAHAARSGQFRYDFAEEVSKMRGAAEKAIALDPLLAEAHDALGMVGARDAQWEQSEQSFRRAIKIDPSRPGVQHRGRASPQPACAALARGW